MTKAWRKGKFNHDDDDEDNEEDVEKPENERSDPKEKE